MATHIICFEMFWLLYCCLYWDIITLCCHYYNDMINHVYSTVWVYSTSQCLWITNIRTSKEFLRTLEKCQKHSAGPWASLCPSRVFFKIPACLYNSTMHLGALFISLIKTLLQTGSSYLQHDQRKLCWWHYSNSDRTCKEHSYHAMPQHQIQSDPEIPRTVQN